MQDGNKPGVANRYLKNLKTAWTWGSELFDGFPLMHPPFTKGHRHTVNEKPRYVPSAQE